MISPVARFRTGIILLKNTVGTDGQRLEKAEPDCGLRADGFRLVTHQVKLKHILSPSLYASSNPAVHKFWLQAAQISKRVRCAAFQAAEPSDYTKGHSIGASIPAAAYRRLIVQSDEDACPEGAVADW